MVVGMELLTMTGGGRGATEKIEGVSGILIGLATR